MAIYTNAASANTLTLAELSDPGEAVKAAIEVYGSNATTAAAYCALEAHFAGRGDDYRYWCTVFRELNEPDEHH